MQVRGPKSGFRKTISARQKLRRDLTPAERIFWSKVASKQFLNLKFRKQHGIGNYIVDFYSPEKKLIVEIDGDTHALQVEYDQKRTEYLRSLGYVVIRYNNLDVLKNIQGVFEDLTKRISRL